MRLPIAISDNLKPLDPVAERIALKLLDTFRDIEVAKDQIERRERTRHGER
jgi:hypothetical protein